MKRNTLIVSIVVAALALAALAMGLRLSSGRQIQAAISNFEDCRKAGYPILESYPEQCKTPDGRTFTRIVNTPPAATTTTAVSSTTPTHSANSYKDQVVVDAPKANAAVSSPLAVSGKARGTWFFEASLPIELRDGNGKVLFEGSAQALGDWMTADFVPFSITLDFPQPQTATGTLIIHKNNPSDMRNLDDEMRIPVRFSNGTAGVQAACYVGGCSGEVCSAEKGVASNCIYKPEFACYKQSFAKCERQASGQCGWTENQELKSCLASGASASQGAQ